MPISPPVTPANITIDVLEQQHGDERDETEIGPAEPQCRHRQQQSADQSH